MLLFCFSRRQFLHLNVSWGRKVATTNLARVGISSIAGTYDCPPAAIMYAQLPAVRVPLFSSGIVGSWGFTEAKDWSPGECPVTIIRGRYGYYAHSTSTFSRELTNSIIVVLRPLQLARCCAADRALYTWLADMGPGKGCYRPCPYHYFRASTASLIQAVPSLRI